MAEKERPQLSLKHRITLGTLLIFLAGIWALSYFASRILREDMERNLGEQQFSTVVFVAASLNGELTDRLHALEKIAHSIGRSTFNNPVIVQQQLEQHVIFREGFNAGVVALARDGTAIADFSDVAGRIGTNYADSEAVHAALVEGRTAIGRPVMGKKVSQPVFDMVAPIRDAEGKVIGALVGMTNLGSPNFLDKLAENRYGKSGYYVLVAPQHKLIVTSTDKTRVMKPLPAVGSSRMLDKAMQGFEGSGVAVNSSGVESLTSAKRIPVAGWLLMSSLPTKEAFSPIDEMQRRIVLAAVLLSLSAAFLAGWMLKREFSPLLSAVKKLSEMSGSGKPLQALPIEKHDEIGDLVGGFNRALQILGQNEAQLKMERDFFSALLQQSSDGVYLLNVDDLSIAEANPSLGQMLGYQRGELIGMKFSELTDTPLDDARASLLPTAQGREDVFGEHTYRKKDGNAIIAEVNSSFVMAGGRQFILASVRDITRRKQREEVLKKNESSLKELFENLNNGVAVYHVCPDGQNFILTALNKTAERIENLKREECIGKTVTKVFPNAREFGLLAALRRVWQDGVAENFPVCSSRNGCISSWRENFVYKLPSGEIAVVSDDVTQRKQTEETLQQSHESLRQLASHLEQIKEDERKRISREIHDDLAQTLLALRMEVSALDARTGAAHPRLNERAGFFLDQIDRTMQSITGIMNNLRPSVLDLGLDAAIGWQVQEFQRNTGIACDLQIDESEFELGLDENLAAALFRTVQESLTNIARHSQATQVRIALHRGGGRLHMTIADNGVGMFPGSRRPANAFGLLAIKERLRVLQGTLLVESDLGRGTKLTISVPTLDTSSQSEATES